MEELLCTPGAVLKWLDIDLGDEGQVDNMIESAILDASDQARDLGVATWTQASVPAQVARVVAAAVARYVRNPDGYTQSRSADEQLGWMDNRDAGTVHFTESEERRIKRAAGLIGQGSGIASVGVYAHTNKPDPGRNDWVFDEDGQPFLMPESEGWRSRWRR